MRRRNAPYSIDDLQPEKWYDRLIDFVFSEKVTDWSCFACSSCCFWPALVVAGLIVLAVLAIAGVL